jgi:mitogen-activated protein kinase organizer 1
MQVERTLTGHTAAVLAVRFNSTGEYCLSGANDNTVRLWSPARGVCIKTYTGEFNQDVFDLQVTPDNTKIVTGGSNKAAYVWDVLTAKVLAKFTGHAAPIRSVSWNPTGVLAFSGSEDATMRVWDVRSKDTRPVQTCSQFKDSVTSIRVSGELIVAGAFDGIIRTFDVRQGAVICDNLKEPVHRIGLAHNKPMTVSSHTDSVIRLTDRSTGALINTYSGRHISVEYAVDVCLTCDDAAVVCGSEDNLVVAYDVAEGVSKTGRGHTSAVTAVDSHPTQPTLVLSGSFDSSIKLWRVTTEAQC